MAVMELKICWALAATLLEKIITPRSRIGLKIWKQNATVIDGYMKMPYMVFSKVI
jgi:hypothetical protein